MVLGRLVDDITFSAALGRADGPTASAILGPFWRADTPSRDNGSNISFDTPADGEPVYMHGKVVDVESGEPLPDATVDVWQASTNGKESLTAVKLYSREAPDTVDRSLRAAGSEAAGAQLTRRLQDGWPRAILLLLLTSNALPGKPHPPRS